MKLKTMICMYSRWGMVLLMYLIIHSINAQTTAIPDPAFEQKLISLGIDSDGLVNGQMLTMDAASINSLDVDNSNINSLEGIEAFVNLSTLSCVRNNLTSLDLTENVSLVSLYVEHNNLYELIVPSTSLSTINCSFNKLLRLDLSNATNVGTLTSVANLRWLRICISNLTATSTQYWLYSPATIITEDCLPKAVKGQVFVDDNTNCILDATEKGLEGQIVEFDKGGQKFYFNTVDTFGNYEANLDTGTYTVTFYASSNYWQPCQLPQTITVDTNYVIQTLNWGLRATVACPLMEVDLAAPFLRKNNGGSFYQVDYCNKGTVQANSAYVEVAVDPDLHVLSTSLPIASQSGNLYTFNVGDVPPGRCGDITIQVLVDSNAVFGQTHCTEAHIYPDSICTNNWQGADLSVVAQCNNDSIRFTITNNGIGMTALSTYYVFEDNIMMRQEPFQLGAGASIDVVQEVLEGSTYRINVDQESGYPSILGDPFVTAVQEGCAPFPNGSFNTGFVTQFSNGNSSPFIAVDCQENIGSYDPNDKSAQPTGYDATHHYIEDNTILDYKIRFQNTGTDTAFGVIVLDTLSAHFNIGSLVMGASSHPYTWKIEDGNVLKVSFIGIMLPDSNVNEPASHGFFRYRIEQQPNNPVGTVINNSAAIYFDYNLPIITNTTWHTVGESFVELSVVVDKIFDEQVDVLVYPNPFKDQTTLEIKGKAYQQVELLIYDVTGKLIRQQQESNQSKLIMPRGELQQGVYFYQLKGDHQLINTGKIIAQ
ncbi:DUF7619 domain-containing protein [Aureispira anguillae]|uniref:T9SS type A sorting domain-containing protein n=1 Tax=Aureispira anguillae TaxID=2864201 RepID=A0A916DVH2_9BACT|nr:T9SS type A sorting domain-containing protein [Aureispira anguillae]BDS14361.1 T9SS type A sorting domain-containing protein [Aureispira anguillae]